MRKRITVMAFMLLCVLGMLAGGGKTVAYAESGSSRDTLSGDVALLKQDNGNYVMQVTVENQGEDFYGTVQVIMASSGSGDNCAYNTEITLPAQGKKQFTFTATKKAVDTVRGICTLNFLDEKGNLLQSVSLSNVLGKALAGISVGILSDNYAGLTYMDAGGQDIYFNRGYYPIQLIELDKDSLRGYLDGLYFLVIDQFNVSVLGEEDIQAIQDWVKKGGWLIIGTGAYAEQTLSGFGQDFLDVEVKSISQPGEDNLMSLNVNMQGVYYNYQDDGIDFTQMAAAELVYDTLNSSFYEDVSNPAIYGAVGDGAVAVYFFSFGEKELQKLDGYVMENIYTDLMYRSNSYQSFDGYSVLENVGPRALAFIDNKNVNVDFTVLEILIGIYVLLAGPVLYLVLRKCKKSEWYWIGVPALGMCFIAAVFFQGQKTRVNDARVYSVTAQQVDSSQADTYFLAYHSGVKEWKLYLDGNYQVAGPGWGGYYYYYSGNANRYLYSVSSDSEGFAVGLKPRENFESGYFYAGKQAESKGTISGAGIRCSGVTLNVEGSITNETACDMAYMAVWSDSYLMVFSDVKAGETLDMQQAFRDGRCVYDTSVSYSDNLYNLLYSMVMIYSSTKIYEQTDMAALLIGLGIAEEKKPTDGEYAVVVGVIEDYERVVASKCSETSYGCLYSYIETEAGRNAAD